MKDIYCGFIILDRVMVYANYQRVLLEKKY